MRSLDVRGLYAGYNGVPVVHGIDLSVESSEIVAIVGPNGAGKSTTAAAIAGCGQRIDGDVVMHEEVVSRAAQRDRVFLGLGYVPQRANVFPDLSVADNLRASASVKSRRPSIQLAYDTFPLLSDRRNQRARTLSGGERQMLAIGSALVSEPTCLILDEPTTGLAPVIVQALVQSIAELREEGTSILWIVEENPSQVIPYTDRVYVMDSGVVRGPYVSDRMTEAELLRAGLFGGTLRQSDEEDASVSRDTSPG